MASKLSLPLPQSLKMMASHSHEVADVAEVIVVRDVAGGVATVGGVISAAAIEGTSVVVTEAASAVVCLDHFVHDIYSLDFSQVTVVNVASGLTVVSGLNAVSVASGLNVVSELNAVSVASGLNVASVVAGLMVTGEATKTVDVVGDAGVDVEIGEVSNL
jgi:hypothetical protein